MNLKKVQGHLAMSGAEVMWGLGAPVGKIILLGGISPLILTECRMTGAAVLFWIISLFSKKEKVNGRDLVNLFFASLMGIVVNQCCFLWGLSLTSPVNASIITTSMPIITMLLAAVVLREPISGKKAGGVALGAAGALLLVLGSGHGTGGGSAAGDVLIVMAQTSFACYLVFFKGLISRYSPVTLMKWMFTFAALCVMPFNSREWIDAEWSSVSAEVISGIVFFVAGPTFLSYLLLPIGQRTLRPTVTAMYNYVQPIVAGLVAVAIGMDHFTATKTVAVILVFAGVYLVSASKSRADVEAAQS